MDEQKRNPEEKEAFRDTFRKKRDKKRGGKTNKENLKNKPFMMVKPKKMNNLQSKFENTKTKLRKLKMQLGKYKKNTKDKIESKKRKFKVRK